MYMRTWFYARLRLNAVSDTVISYVNSYQEMDEEKLNILFFQ